MKVTEFSEFQFSMMTEVDPLDSSSSLGLVGNCFENRCFDYET